MTRAARWFSGRARRRRDQGRDLGALLGLGRGGAAAADQLLGQLGRRGRPVAQVVQRRVADDPVEPRPQLDLGVAAAQGLERLAEGVLGDVLGAAADDRRGEAVERPPVAPHDLLEGALVALAHQAHQPPVRLRAQRRAEDEAGGQATRGRGYRVDSHAGIPLAPREGSAGRGWSPCGLQRSTGGSSFVALWATKDRGAGVGTSGRACSGAPSANSGGAMFR